MKIINMKKHFVRQCAFILFASLLLAGCGRKYDRTVTVCDDSLYVEVFDVILVDEKEDYLTDSVNFRLFVGKADGEHENFNYRCEGDTISIRKITSAPYGKKHVLNVRKYSLTQLKKHRIFDY